MKLEHKKILLILGPHRSGTSLITKLASCYRYSLTNNLIPGNEYNKKGYFEDKDIVKFNETLLHEIKSSWNSNLFISNEEFNVINNKQNIKKAKSLIHSKLIDQDKIVIKDPRMSILLPFWNKVFDEINIEAQYICLLRNPFEVANSLMRRDGSSISFGFILWAIYSLDVVINLESKNLIFFNLNTIRKDLDNTRDILDTFFKEDIDEKKFSEFKNNFFSNQLFSSPIEDEKILSSTFVTREFRDIYRLLLSISNKPLTEETYAATKIKLIQIKNFFIENNIFQFFDKEYQNQEVRRNFFDGLYQEKVKRFEMDKEKALKEIETAENNLNIETLNLQNEQKKVVSMRVETSERLKKEQKLLADEQQKVLEERKRVIEKEAQLEKLSDNSIKSELVILSKKIIKKILIKMSLLQFYYQFIASIRSINSNSLSSLAMRRIKSNFEFNKFIVPSINISAKKLQNHLESKTYKNKTTEVSIIIPVYDKWNYTLNCINSIYNSSSKYNYEVIIMDDCSKEESPPIIKKFANKDYSNLRYFKNDTNQGFIKNCNLGASEATGKYIIFLNNDTVVFPDWLNAMVDTFIKNKNVGVVGSKIIYNELKLQEAGGIIWNDASGMNFGKGDDPGHPKYNYVKEVDYVSGCSFAIKKDLFIDTGKFDDDLEVAYYEDVSKCFQVRDMGYSVLYQPRSVIVHFEGVTNGTDISSGVKQYQEKNRRVFQRKYLENSKIKQSSYQSLKSNNCEKFSNEIFKNQRILIIDNCIPTPDQDEGSLYMWNLIKFLKKDGNLIKFVASEELHETRPEYFEQMRQIGVECGVIPYFNSTESFIKEYAGLFTIAIVTRVNNADKFLDTIRKYNPNIKVIFNTIDLHHLRELRHAQLINNQLEINKALDIKDIELKYIRRSNKTIVVSSKEKEYLASEGLKTENISVLPLLRENKEKNISKFRDRSNSLVFIGNFNHSPNVDALEYLINDLWPFIKLKSFEDHSTNLSLEIVGLNLPEKILNEIKSSKSNIIYHGFVKNLDPIMEKAKLSIAPLRYGAGLKGKIVSSFEYGVPVIGTEIAFEGINIKHIDCNNSFLASNQEEYYSNIMNFILDERKWESISSELIKFVKDNYSVEGNEALIRDIIY